MTTINMDKDISNLVAVSGTWTLTLFDVVGVLPGMKANVVGMSTPSWNVNNLTITAVNTTLKTVTYVHANTTVPSTVIVLGFLHLQCNWIDTTYVTTLIGYTPTGGDLTFLDNCTQAANDWAFGRRQEAGYTDQPGAAPSANVKLGTGLYAMSLYRERGSVDSFQSFEAAPIAGFGTMGQVNKLVGIPRSQIA